MQPYDRLLAANRAYVDAGQHSSLPVRPSRALAIVTCMDARILVEEAEIAAQLTELVPQLLFGVTGAVVAAHHGRPGTHGQPVPDVRAYTCAIVWSWYLWFLWNLRLLWGLLWIEWIHVRFLFLVLGVGNAYHYNKTLTLVNLRLPRSLSIPYLPIVPDLLR
jgi:hypothetical protein